MDWTADLNNYCERLEPGFWGEPINAFTNLAFFVVALFVVPRIKGDRGALILTFSIFLIGLGSGLFHTFATQWAALADSLSILLFILTYLYYATQRILGKDKAVALLAVLLFIPYAFVMERVLGAVLGNLNGSIQYVPVLILIFAFGAVSKARETRSGLWIGCLILAVSLLFRSIDQATCAVIPIGTHFLWHILNACMLGWMVLVLHGTLPAQARSGVARD